MKQPTIALLVLLTAGPAFADDVARYSLRAVSEGTLRLDLRTGETTLCTTDGGRLRCAVSAEEREAYEREIDALSTRIEALEQRLAAIEPEPGAEPVAQKGGVDRALSLADRALRGFAGTVRRLRSDLLDG